MTVLRQGSAGELATPAGAMVRASHLRRRAEPFLLRSEPICHCACLSGFAAACVMQNVVSPDRPGAERGCRLRWERATVVMRLSHWSFMDDGRRKPEAGRGEHGGTAGFCRPPLRRKAGVNARPLSCYP